MLFAGVCAHVNELNRVDVVDCSLAMNFELTTSGQLKVAGDDQCLTVQSNSYVVSKRCISEQQQQQPSDKGDAKPLKEQQQWKFVPADAAGGGGGGTGDTRDQLLVNAWSRFCAMHVTDPLHHSVRWRQIVMAQNCSAESRRSVVSFSPNTQQFTLWTFVNV